MNRCFKSIKNPNETSSTDWPTTTARTYNTSVVYDVTINWLGESYVNCVVLGRQTLTVIVVEVH